MFSPVSFLYQFFFYRRFTIACRCPYTLALQTDSAPFAFKEREVIGSSSSNNNSDNSTTTTQQQQHFHSHGICCPHRHTHSISKASSLLLLLPFIRETVNSDQAARRVCAFGQHRCCCCCWRWWSLSFAPGSSLSQTAFCAAEARSQFFVSFSLLHQSVARSRSRCEHGKVKFLSWQTATKEAATTAAAACVFLSSNKNSHRRKGEGKDLDLNCCSSLVTKRKKLQENRKKEGEEKGRRQ